MTVRTYAQTLLTPAKTILFGALAGVGGGVVFGMMMAWTGMLPMVGMLAGQSNAVVGFGVHLVISVLIGAIYGWFVTRNPATLTTALVAGILNGVVWWVLGALLLMPLMLGMPEMIFSIGPPQWMSLVGHLVYGLITALLYNQLVRR